MERVKVLKISIKDLNENFLKTIVKKLYELFGIFIFLKHSVSFVCHELVMDELTNLVHNMKLQHPVWTLLNCHELF
jgi:hypothetical protein